MKIDWTQPLTLCWCGFEFHGTQYAQPYLGSLAETINEMHLRTHDIEARAAAIYKRRAKIEQIIYHTLETVPLDPDVLENFNVPRR